MCVLNGSRKEEVPYVSHEVFWLQQYKVQVRSRCDMVGVLANEECQTTILPMQVISNRAGSAETMDGMNIRT